MWQWSDQLKLINVLTRLGGTAYDFYRSCTADERASYHILAKLLSKRLSTDSVGRVTCSTIRSRVRETQLTLLLKSSGHSHQPDGK